MLIYGVKSGAGTVQDAELWLDGPLASQPALFHSAVAAHAVQASGGGGGGNGEGPGGGGRGGRGAGMGAVRGFCHQSLPGVLASARAQEYSQQLPARLGGHASARVKPRQASSASHAASHAALSPISCCVKFLRCVIPATRQSQGSAWPEW